VQQKDSKVRLQGPKISKNKKNCYNLKKLYIDAFVNSIIHSVIILNHKNIYLPLLNAF